ncbi:hypothetical protein [Polaromonas hydrogenivorans]|uniref:Uncharacterized protein n=1 Tax=Polaromonas hydrogenivorans TaxID=335476 RepID=A0AAU7M0B4_9BURK
MAENEILDLKTSSRWRRTRAALAKPDLSVAAMAECAADNLQSELQRSLAQVFRKGQTLLTILQAVDEHPSAMRAAIRIFQDQQLARIARDAAKAAVTKDISTIAQCAADMLIDGLMKQALILANNNGCFQDRQRIEALESALTNEFSVRRSTLVAVIETSLQGQPVKKLKTVRKNRIPMTAGAAVLIPLAIVKRGGNHVPRPY